MSGAEGATVRERATAALGLWERAIERFDRSAREAAEKHLLELANEFRLEAASPNCVAPTGLRWTADTLTHVIKTDQKVSNTWPDSDEPCLMAVREVADSLSGAPEIISATRFLFQQALLQNAGVYRRRAIDALHVGGWAEQVVGGLKLVLSHPGIEPWFRCRALFALGYLQDRGNGVEVTLCDAYERARTQLAVDTPSRDLISEMHAALFAIGDCFGATGAENAASRMRNAIDPSMLGLVGQCTSQRTYRIARAAAYVVAVTAQPHDRPTLQDLATHPDVVTKQVAEWALAARYNADGAVQPIHAPR